MRCSHRVPLFLFTGWLMHVFCGECYKWIATELDEEVHTVARDGRAPLNHKPLEVNGVTKTYLEWSRVAGIEPELIRSRIRVQGWTPAEAVYTAFDDRRRGRYATRVGRRNEGFNRL